jgi:hypothetical protein
MMIQRRHFIRLGGPVAGLFLSAGIVFGQEPLAASGIPAPAPMMAPPPLPQGHVCEHPEPGRLHRAWARFNYKLHDCLIGYPQYFGEPPLGTTEFNHYVGHKRAAMPHRFFFYQSDFVAGTDRLTPDGVMRLSRMITELDRWPGPILVEPLSDSPGLTEQRRSAVSNQLAMAGVPSPSERVMLAYSPYPGVIGDYSATTGGFPAGIYNNFINRSNALYPLTYPPFTPINVFTLQGGQ